MSTINAPETPEVTKKYALDLDTLERANPTQAFEFRHNGFDFVLFDPKEVDWQDMLIAVGDPVLFLHKLLPTEQHEAFFSAKMPAWKMDALMERYRLHFELPDPKAADA